MIANYITTALRNLLRNKGLSVINLTGLAIGLAVFILIFLWVLGELSYDSYNPLAKQIYRVNFTYEREGQTKHHWRTPPALAKALKEEYPEVLSSSRFYTIDKMLVAYGADKHFYRVPGYADSSLFSMFNMKFLQGDAGDAFRNPWSMVIPKKMASLYFGEEDPMGKQLKLDNRFDFTVTGVIEDQPGDSYLEYDFLIPFRHMEEILGYGTDEDWNDFGYNTFLLLPENIDTEEFNSKISSFLETKLETVARDLFVQRLRDIHLYGLDGSGVIRSIFIFSSIALFVLLIACINYMNLTTARSMRRSREVAIRKVGGATRRQLIFQFFSESVILTFVGLIVAVGLVFLALPLFNDLAGKTLSLNLLNLPMIGLLLLTTLITGLIAGSYPALLLSSIKPITMLNKPVKPASAIFRKILVVFQFALSVFLIICTIFFSRQLDFLGNQKLGFQIDHIVFVPMNERLMAKFSPFREELLSSSAISGVSATSNKIGTRPFWGTVLSTWQGSSGEERMTLNIIYADCDFQKTFDLPMASGHYYASGSAVDSAGIVINEMAVRRMGMEDPLGKTMFNDSTPIIGVLKDFNFRSLHAGIEPLVIIIDPQWFTNIGIRISSANIPETIAFIQKTALKFAPEFPFEYSFLDDDIATMYAAEQRMRKLFNYFSFLAIFITCLGLFGLASFAVDQRTREIGIRKVMGATAFNISIRFVREYTILILLANLIAWPAAWYAMSRWLEGFAYKTDLTLWVFIVAGAITFLVAMLTMSSQTIRAASTNPADTLKYE